MNSAKCIVSIISLVMLVIGCDDYTRITSATPDTGTTLYLNPGEMASFSVTVDAGPGFNGEGWGLFNNNASITQRNENRNYGRIEDYFFSEPGVFTQQYMPDDDSPGSYEMQFVSEDLAQVNEDIYVPVNSVKRTWNVIVPGIEVLPETNISALPYASQTYKAKAYPASSGYRYTWFLDDTNVGTGSQYTFNPTLEACGLHTLKVTAVKSDEYYEYSRQIIVPFAKIDGDNSDNFIPCADGGFIVPLRALTTVAGNSGLDGCITKINAQGEVLWRTLCGGDLYDTLTRVAPTTDGGVIACGYSNSTAIGNTINSAEAQKGFIVRLDKDGKILFQKLFDSGSEKNHLIRTIQQTRAGDFIAMGYADRDIWVLKLSSSGELAWGRTIQSLDTDRESGVIIENEDTYLLGYADAVCSLDPDNGEILWQTLLNIGGNETATVNAILPAEAGGFTVSGYTYSYYGNQHPIAYIAKLDPAGALIWNRSYSDLDGLASFAVTTLLPGDTDAFHVLAGGCTTQSTDMGGYDALGMVMIVDQAGEVKKEIRFGERITNQINMINHLAPTTTPGKAMALFTAEGIPYLVPVDISVN